MIVTNGATAQQEAKIRAVGLDGLICGWVVSESVGVAKPDPEIFRAAARLAGCSLDRGWMIGDDPERDIAGAAGLGLATAWLGDGRSWSSFAPAKSWTAMSPLSVERSIWSQTSVLSS